MTEKPIFYDASGRRRRQFRLAVAAFLLILFLAAAIFIASVLAVLPAPQLPFEAERPALHGPRSADFAHRSRQAISAALRYAGQRWRGHSVAGNTPLATAFYTPWDDASAASLQRHINQIDWLVPGWLSISGADHHVTSFPDARGKAILSRATRRPTLLPMIQNALNGEWDGKNMAALLANPAARKTTLDRVEALLLANDADGAFFDFEDLPASAHVHYRAFLAEAHARFARRNWIVAIAVPADNPDWDLRAYAAVADKLFLMAYDEHYQGGSPGPIVSQPWFEDVVASAAHTIPAQKLVVALASYAYDWKAGGDTEALADEDAWLLASKSGVKPVYDKASGNSSFSYLQQGANHDVWIADAAAAHNQIAFLKGMGIHALALWRLGSEDPSIWSMFGRKQGKLPPASAIQAIPPGNVVDIDGSGEILHIGSLPVGGWRAVTADKAGLITDVRFDKLPSPYVVQRTGYKPGLVALTFDDGPDPEWTPQILDILKAKGVPATFFIVGENGLTEHGLLQRLVAEGHEVGSHTYTHPNLANASPGETTIELNTTQRLFQAFTGYSLRLFRAPYFGDAEPTTADELGPVYEAQKLGYLSVGLHVDPGDWKRPGVQAIIDRTVEGVEQSNYDRSGNVVLLHDAGGDRSQTVEALPALIDRLKAKGYRFVPISTLAGWSRAQAMPPITASDLLAARADLGLFLFLGWVAIALKWLFLVAITLGIARAIVLSALALRQARQELRTVFPPIDPSQNVTVLIPAFNEERVIVRAITRVLESSDVQVSVIVIDDGSKDRTSAVVREAFATDPRVRLLTLQNGGKARALNHALDLVDSEIVIALDADTQFEPTTIARLSRWFVNPALGAVAGNAKVGNRVNLVTRWQALEYITAQNLERRALARLNAMTVIPGAVGAWRTRTLREVGGYPADTLAEDQDLTIAIQRAGWKVHYDQFAIALTEAPESFRALAKQRFRWAFGTLQCLWKHRAILRSGHPTGLARIGLPQAITFQIILVAISPIIDLALIVSMIETALRVSAHGWAQTHTDLSRMLTFWIVFTAIDLLAAVIAFALERRERWSLLWLLIPQRIGYRQVMYYVVLKAIVQAIRGPVVGWGKLERSGRVAAR